MHCARLLVVGFLASTAFVFTGCSKGDGSVDGSVDGAGTIVINEILAVNKAGLADEDGELSDWIELKNIGDEAVALEGWSLTDDRTLPAKWLLPKVDIPPGAFVVVYASGKDRAGTSLHTNFKLNAAGEYLGLYGPADHSFAQSEFAEGFGEQRSDISFGTHDEPGYFYLAPPTPGAENLSSTRVEGAGSGIVLSHAAGLFFEPIELSISGGGNLYYTLDGAVPSPASPAASGSVKLTLSTQVRVLRVPEDGTDNIIQSFMFIRADTSLRNVKSHLPIVVVDSFENDAIDSEGRPRTYSISATAIFEVADSNQEVSLADAPTFVGRTGIHIRGNSTAGYEKKQYSLETWDEQDKDVDVSLLGFPSDSDWVLHAPFSDKTLMRNHLMYQWSREMGRYASRTKFIELYLNKDSERVGAEDYVGVYVLMEKVKQGSERVNVSSLSNSTTAEPDTSGGYLLERGWNFSEDIGIRTQRYDDELQFIYPKAEDINTQQRGYLQQFFDSFEAALSGDSFADSAQGYAKYIDVDSFIDHHLLVEFGRNIDGYVLSTFMHKDRNGLLNMGPIWDYNGALGNPDYFEGDLVNGWHYDNPEFPADNPNGYHWYTRLFEDPAFRARYSARWQELRANVLKDDKLMADIEQAVTALGTAGDRNFERWNILGDYIWPNASGWDERDTFRKEVDYMKDWIRDRAAWIDSELAGSQ